MDLFIFRQDTFDSVSQPPVPHNTLVDSPLLHRISSFASLDGPFLCFCRHIITTSSNFFFSFFFLFKYFGSICFVFVLFSYASVARKALRAGRARPPAPPSLNPFSILFVWLLPKGYECTRDAAIVAVLQNSRKGRL